MNLPNSLGYRQFAQQQIHYALGDTGRSFVVGFGVNPPTSPSHRSRYRVVVNPTLQLENNQHFHSSCPNLPATCDWSTYSSSTPNSQTLYGGRILLSNVYAGS